MSNIDPVSIAAGIGAGQEMGRREGEMAADAARTRAEIAEIHAGGAREAALMVTAALQKERREKAVLENEIHNRWIPYGVRLKASIIANKIERQTLIDELRRLDPANVDVIAARAAQNADVEYDRQAQGAELAEVNRLVREESEAGRLG